MNKTPLAEQIQIVLYGMRNSGKSSLMNNLFEREVSIVSEHPGTTTDPVTKSMELGRLGPVAFHDTAGFDDEGDLGLLRIKRTYQKVDIADIILLVTKADSPLQQEEKEFLQKMSQASRNILVVLTFADKSKNIEKEKFLQNYTLVAVSNLHKTGIQELRVALMEMADKIEYEISPVEGLVEENDLVVLVTPIDLAAPKGRLILPQVESIRDLLDKDCATLILKERELGYFYPRLPEKPRLIITDSQVFSKVAADIPPDQLLTSFSILFARKKGDLCYFVKGVKALENTPPGSKILILESCSHHRQADDIGTVKIPRLFRQMVQPDVHFDFSRELPDQDKIKEYYMVINCAGCMVTRKSMMQRVNTLKKHGIHALNYGLFLAWANGLLPRVLEPFPDAYEIYRGV
ncbi:MAG: [FeFe] hydrogenase H-cluster maturation GTPase HydF [Candidatus Brocadiae bacterium]|nr:[FeFe] hydrogenase H-cluster maturation GTPase HydF [Candidatus Brocadiia bacterium]